MPRLGGAVIPMHQNLTSQIEYNNDNLIKFEEYNISYQVGDARLLTRMQVAPVWKPFTDQTIEFLNTVSRILLSSPEAKGYPDVITLAFWMRKASLEQLRKRFMQEEAGMYRRGRGVIFHIAPSNVPVNYAYSLVTGLLCGNFNVVRIPSKDFPQVKIINRAINQALEKHTEMIPYLVLVQYGHESIINDALSSIADVRVVWGGDNTINELRNSPMKPRATEITFSDRYSIAVIDSDKYMKIQNKAMVSKDFYNDTYLSDQNACTSPRMVIWMGNSITEAKRLFWEELHNLLAKEYELQGVQAVNKLTSAYLLAVKYECVTKEEQDDNLIVRMKVNELSSGLMDYQDNSGYFFEYECKDILELKELCNDTRCQTLSYIGDAANFMPLLESGIRGIDRIVPVGKTMDFELHWDGYNLFERFTNTITIR